LRRAPLPAVIPKNCRVPRTRPPLVTQAFACTRKQARALSSRAYPRDRLATPSGEDRRPTWAPRGRSGRLNPRPGDATFNEGTPPARGGKTDPWERSARPADRYRATRVAPEFSLRKRNNLPQQCCESRRHCRLIASRAAA